MHNVHLVESQYQYSPKICTMHPDVNTYAIHIYVHLVESQYQYSSRTMHPDVKTNALCGGGESAPIFLQDNAPRCEH